MPGLGLPVARAISAKSSDMPPGVCLNSTSNAATAVGVASSTTTAKDMVNGKPKLDPSDPRVRKLVYSMYRGMLTTYNDEANDIISKKDPAKVTQDLGVGPILESIIIKQRSSQGSCDTPEQVSTATPESEGQSEVGASNGTATMPPPPPPPPMMPGAIPAVRLSSEIGPRDKGPPAAIASAMMKDKKPFTYTPGGIDLSEIRSPRMAKRIQMNAAAEGVTNVPSSSSHQERAPCNLPPAALAAMQPQMAIPVFPQGNINSVQLNKMHKPADYAGGPPPPPPPPVMSTQVVRPQAPPPAPSSPQPSIQSFRQSSPPQPMSPPPPPPARTPPLERATTPRSPLPVTESYLAPSSPSNNDDRSDRRSPVGRKSPSSAESGVGTGSLFIPTVPASPSFPSPPSPVSNFAPPSSRPAGQTKAQAVSQNIGSLYIPPIGAQQADTQQPTGSSGSTSNGNIPVSKTPQSAQAMSSAPQTATPPSATPQLNKAPTPWMNSYNRMQNQQADSPPYVHPGFFMPPWTPPLGARTIPIMMARESDQMDGPTSPFQGMTDSRRSSSASGGSTPSGSRTPSQAATHLGRVIPIQIEREEAGRAKGAKIIPIQIEGRPPRGMTPSTPTTPFTNPMRRGPPPYNSPMGLYSNQNVMDAYQRQAAEAAAGVDRMSIRCESPRTEPMQSKAMRVIQQAAENELKRIEQEQQANLDAHLKSQVDEGSSFQTAEPRFMGGHIPSKAFKALQTALPTSSAGAQDQPPSSYATGPPGGAVTHHIPIRQVAQSPTPQSQASEIQLSSQSNVHPSEQKVQEPRKYMGSNIPSRSFKILQAMTAEDGQPVEGSTETCATGQNIADSYNDDTCSPCPLLDPNNVPLSPSASSSSYPLSLSCSSEGGGSATFDPYNINSSSIIHSGGNNNDNSPSSQNPWSEVMDQGWDPYSYMWYYWWYYTSCYWAGYDMTGYEYPPGWDPNYPYCPPDFFADYSALSEYTAASESTASAAEHEEECNLDKDSSSLEDLHKSLHPENEVGEGCYYSHNNKDFDNSRGRMMPHDTKNNSRGAALSSLSSTVPQIVIEDEVEVGEREGRNTRKNVIGSVDSIKDNKRNSASSLCYNHNNNNNNNDGNTKAKAPYTNPLTECNQKPGNPTSRKQNDCDSVFVADERMRKVEQEKSKFAECKQQLQQQNQQFSKNDSENGADEKRAQNERGNAMSAYDEEDSLASSSDDEYESCCEDSEQKVIERETGPSSNSKPFVTSSTSQNVPHHFSESSAELQQESHQRKFELFGNYNGELNANAVHDRIRDGKGKSQENMKEPGKIECDDNHDDDDEDEKTDPGTDEDNDEEDDYGGRPAIIEEPETPSSADDSDMTPLASEFEQENQGTGKSSFYYGNGLSIEEYHSENSSSESAVFDYGLKKNRLSTIDEITESRASSSVFSRSSSATTPTIKNLSAEFDSCANKNNIHLSGIAGNLISEQKSSRSQNDAGITTTGESDESEESSDELSSVSVIENKSDATRGTTESKREDETTSTSEDESSTDDDDDNVNNDYGEGDEEDDDDAAGADTAVTVRLPLKLCFTKTKSYKDITTVMVGDSEIEEASQTSSSESYQLTAQTVSTRNENRNLVDAVNEFPVNDTEDEPVVSFTLSLSRQTSREDETKARDEQRDEGHRETGVKKRDAGESEEAPDIDFWAEITKGESEEEKKCEKAFTSTTATADNVKSNQEPKEDYQKENNSGATDMGFWGIICRDRSASDFSRGRRKQNERENTNENCNQNGSSQEHVKMRRGNDDKPDWDPYERIDYKWEKDFNFWEKSSRTIETRRFSGNFEITEDYESDSGIKPSVERRERVKKYTHKRHSISGPSSGYDRSSLPPRPAAKQSTSNFPTNNSASTCNEQEIKIEEGKTHGNGSNRTTTREDAKANENNNNNDESLSSRKIVDSYREDSESSWWSYWDDVTKEKDEHCKDATSLTTAPSKPEEPGGTCSWQEHYNEMEGTTGIEDEESSVDITVEIKMSSEKHTEETRSGRCSGENDYQSFASMQAVRTLAGESGGCSSLLETMELSKANDRKSLNHSCQSDATTANPDSEDHSSSVEIKCSAAFSNVANQEAEKLIQQGSAYVSISDENSDESSSRSSGTTIGRHDKSAIKNQIPDTTSHSSKTPPAVAAACSVDMDSASEIRCLKASVVKQKDAEEEQEEQDEDDNVEGEDEEEEESESVSALADTSAPAPMPVEKYVEIQRETTDERGKFNGKEQHYHHKEEHYHHHHSSTCTTSTSAINTTSSSATCTTTTTTCTCLMSDRIARAENLLWRIERFLHESLSLGSEDDSGVMTDLSRQISDVDTDVDNDLNETEFLLTAAAAAKERRGMAFTAATNGSGNCKEAQHIESCNFGETLSSTDASMHHQPQPPDVSPSNSGSVANTTATCTSPSTTQVKKQRPKSDIFLESTLLSKVESEDATSTVVTEGNNGVKMRSASERRALRYQRAKTHSRLFQLLQDECGRDEEQEEFDYDSDVATPTVAYKITPSINGNSMNAVDCLINVDTGCGTDTHYRHSPTGCKSNVVVSEDNNSVATSPTRMNDTQARRSRLLPLPIKNLLASSLSLDSNSSPSGSSGVLSPTSPVNRDQLLADIINEFHLRNQASTMRAQNQRRISSSFPSKIFRLLQHEFGEEFYQTFDCCGGGGGDDSLISPSASTHHCVNDSSSDEAPLVHECTIHKSESMKEFEEATNRILTNFMLRNATCKQTKAGCCQSFSESPSCTANLSSQSLQDDSNKTTGSVDFLDVPLRRKKGHLSRDPRNAKSTKTS